MTSDDSMRRIDRLLSHVWMVRAFLKHSEEAQEDDELAEVHRDLYDYMLALGAPLQAQDAASYLKLAKKKLGKLLGATERFREIQPEVSQHTNFQMAVLSLTSAVEEVRAILSSANDIHSS